MEQRFGWRPLQRKVGSVETIKSYHRIRREQIRIKFRRIGFVVRSGVSALVVAFLLGYAAHYEWGLSRVFCAHWWL
jgi:hypothetical protein